MRVRGHGAVAERLKKSALAEESRAGRKACQTGGTAWQRPEDRENMVTARMIRRQ